MIVVDSFCFVLDSLHRKLYCRIDLPFVDFGLELEK